MVSLPFDKLRMSGFQPSEALRGVRAVLTGWCTPQRHRIEFLAFMDRSADRYPKCRVHCVLDNLNTQLGPEVSAWLERHDRFVFHFTPFHPSWINQIEVWLSILTRRLLRGASFQSLFDLETESRVSSTSTMLAQAPSSGRGSDPLVA